ncbi:MAG: MmcQ/YjbR family DNA-binding protein, partial [Terracidiphilus sp.]
LARAHWVTLERWNALRHREIEEELRRAYTLIFEKLAPRTKKVLAMPEKERTKLIRECKKLLSARKRS